MDGSGAHKNLDYLFHTCVIKTLSSRIAPPSDGTTGSLLHLFRLCIAAYFIWHMYFREQKLPLQVRGDVFQPANNLGNSVALNKLLNF